MATHSSILAQKIPMDRGAWPATVHRVVESDTTETNEHAGIYTHEWYCWDLKLVKEVPSRPQGPHLYNGNNTYLTSLLRGLSDIDLGKLLDP